MVEIFACSKHETFGPCTDCKIEALREENDALRAELERVKLIKEKWEESGNAAMEEMGQLRAALEWYADSKNWTSMTDGWKQLVCVDSSDREYIPGNELMIQTGGKRAREALERKLK